MELQDTNSFCLSQNVTYDHRVYDPDSLNWCPVPGGGADALLFAGLAVFCSCALYSKLSAVWVLLAGALFQVANVYLNMNHFSNALTIWLGMHPSTIFFQIFLPPLLLDSAVRVDFFLFKKIAVHCLLFASLNVLVATLAFIPLMLYGLNLAAVGWRPVDAALFGAMLGSTDAVAVTAILKAGGAPEMLSTLLEGESLFNDASSIVLFEIFLHMGMTPGGGGDVSLAGAAGHILKLIAWLSATGAAAGLLMGFCTRLLLKMLHRRHVPPPVEVAVSVAGAYTVYLCTEYYVQGSGVIGVVVYGLYGASSYLYGFSTKGMRQQSFFRFWDVAGFCINGMVFFFVGASVTNFLIRLTGELFQGSSGAALLTLRCVPAIVAATFGLRWALMALEAPLLALVGPRLSWQEVAFSTAGGLRGGLALILAHTVLASHGSTKDPQLKVVHAEMVIWVAAVVLFTLTVNAPLLGPLMTVLGLNKVTPAQRHMHRRAYAALAQFTCRTIAELQADDDEILRSVDWSAVACSADMSKALKKVLCSTDTITAQIDGGSRSARQSTEFHDPPSNKRAQSKVAAPPAATLPGQSSLLSDVYSASDDAHFDSDRGSMEQQGFNGSSGVQYPEGPIVLTRASLAAASRSTFPALTVPLLGRQYSSRAAERYSSAAGHDDVSEGSAEGSDPAGDVESGLQQPRMPRVVAESSSEAVFIASRLQQQDEELAKHAHEADGGGPLLANAHHAAAATPAAGLDAASDSYHADAAAADDSYHADGEEQHEEAEDAAGEWSSSSGAEAEAPEGDQGAAVHSDAAAAPAAAAAAGKKAEFKPLQPLIVLHMTDVARFSNQFNMTGAYGHVHSAALASAAPPAAAVAAAAAAGRGAGGGSGSGSSQFRSSSSKARLGRPGGAGNLSSVYRQQQHMAHQGGRNEALGGALVAAQRAWSTSLPAAAASTPTWQQQQQQQRQFTGRSVAAGQAVGLPAGGGDDGRCLLGDFAEMLSDVSAEEEGMTAEELLEECRVSLLAGLKRHFWFKAAEGLLSKTSLRLLDYGCDACLSQPGKPLDLWRTIGSDIRRRGATSSMAAAHLQLRRYQTRLLRLTSGNGGFLVGWLLHGPVQRASRLLHNRLGIAALTVLEVALELWLALTASPQARMLRQGHSQASAMLQEELQAQADIVWRFIMDRQIEAPDEFASLQTHRVQLAVARRQLAFVEQLAEVGAVEDVAAEALQEMVERRLHRLESRGPSWESPSLIRVLRRQPFLADQSEGMLLWLRAYGELISYSPGQCIVPRRRAGPPGVFIVLSGLVRVELVRARQPLTYFVGVGGSVGFLSSLLGRDLPGVALVAAFAQGNALGRGPLVLHLPMRLLATIRQRAAAALPAAAQPTTLLRPAALSNYSPDSFNSSTVGGATGSTASNAVGGTGPCSMNAMAFAQLLLDMHRQAGVMLLDRMGDAVVQHMAAHVEGAVQAIFDYAGQLPPAKAASRLQRLLEALLGSSSGSALAAAGFADAVPGSSAAAGADHFALAADTAGRSSGSLRGSAAGGSELQAAVAEAALQLVLERGAAAAARLRGLLHSADLITVAPGQQVRQSSSLVLLLGCLRLNNSSRFNAGMVDPAAAAAAAGGAAGAASAGGGAAHAGCSSAMRQFHAPTLLAWGPELFEQLEDRYDQQAAVYTAGPKGALLLLTPSDSGSSGSSEAGDAGAASGDVAADRELQQQEQPDQNVELRAAATAGAHAARGGRDEQRQQLERLSSVRPLHRTAAAAVGPDQDAV